MKVDGFDGRFQTARAFLAEAAQATCDYDRKLFQRVGARYFKAAIGVDAWVGAACEAASDRDGK